MVVAVGEGERGGTATFGAAWGSAIHGAGYEGGEGISCCVGGDRGDSRLAKSFLSCCCYRCREARCCSEQLFFNADFVFPRRGWSRGT